MAQHSHFQDNIRPATGSDIEDYHTDEDLIGDGHFDSDSSEAEPENQPDSEPEDDVLDVDQKLNTVSFGALKKANDSLSKKRKADNEHGPDQEAKLESLRKRLQLIRKEKRQPVTVSKKQSAASFATNEDDVDEDSDDSSGPEETTTKGRAKHAPASQSSKHQVSRKRQVIEVPKMHLRDPRFDTVRYAPSNTDAQDKAYAFLRDYQKSEMQELKTAMKKTKSQDDKDVLRRKLNAMENRLKAKEAKEREQDIVRKHRKQERDQVREGKTPYFLKRSEIKQQALVEKFQSMKSKDREHLMERRRKKESQKEKRRMPEMRRGVS
ncbi:hypothetical protein AMS68_007566 [Peltaster fructicola]|uniref:rRNA biogenesis protein RRP36 n=1 Tax=Peltaster fructicola TaxID=286661 RepID=A0A6H0Y5E3_9PEZI|nr:hypothetical protein AMS68_007566 [Peltaster fructicola]